MLAGSGTLTSNCGENAPALLLPSVIPAGQLPEPPVQEYGLPVARSGPEPSGSQLLSLFSVVMSLGMNR